MTYFSSMHGMKITMTISIGIKARMKVWIENKITVEVFQWAFRLNTILWEPMLRDSFWASNVVQVI